MKRGRRLNRWVGGAISLAVALLVWQLAVEVSPRVLPSFSSLATTLVKLAKTSLWINIFASLDRVLIAFVIAAITGTIVGFLIGWFPNIRLVIEPWVQFIRMVPSIAFVPLVVVFFGIGNGSKILVIWLAAFLTITVGMMQGVTNVDPVYIKAARVLGANEWTLFGRVIVPATVPYMLVGFRLGLANAWTTVVAAELIASSHGLGYMIEQASEFYEVSVIVIGIIMIGIIGILMDRGVQWLEARVTRWKDNVNEA